MKFNYIFVFGIFILLLRCENDQVSGLENNGIKSQKENKEQPKSYKKKTPETIVVQPDQKGNLVFLTGKTDKGFQKMYVVQMEKPATIEKRSIKGTINRNENNISIYTDQGLTYIYTIDQKEIENRQSENVISKKSYGISEHEGMFEIIEHSKKPSHFYDIVINHTVSDQTISQLMYLTHESDMDGGGYGTDCTSGGKGSTECSITGPFNGCSVSCSPGYYACCDDSVVVCKCLKKEKA